MPFFTQTAAMFHCEHGKVSIQLIISSDQSGENCGLMCLTQQCVLDHSLTPVIHSKGKRHKTPQEFGQFGNFENPKGVSF